MRAVACVHFARSIHCLLPAPFCAFRWRSLAGYAGSAGGVIGKLESVVNLLRAKLAAATQTLESQRADIARLQKELETAKKAM
mgnify:CR=1 FL=1